MRIGGATQEAITKLPNAKFMNALIQLHCRFGVRYIIGLPLFQKAPELPLAFKAHFDAAFRDYPFAIVNYELGNEPNYWPTKAGGFTQISGATTCSPVQTNNPAYQLVGTMDTPADGSTEGFAVYRDAQEPYTPYKPQSYCYTPQTTVFAAGVDNYNIYFQRAANALTGCGGITQDFQATWGWPYWGPPGFNRRVLSGPAWGDFTKDINAFKTFLQNSNQCYLSEATFHYYGPNRNTTFEELFSRLTTVNRNIQPPRALISIAKDFIQAARASNITLRVSESGSVPDGGQSNLSNTIGAAIWTLVTAMEFAQAGASGINFHWGDGGFPPGVGRAPAYVGVQTGFRNDTQQMPYPLVRVPFYGYVMFSRAFGDNGPGIFLNYSSDAIVSECREYVFTYAILVPHAGMVSVVVANANPNITCDVTATLPGVLTTSAALQLLKGPRGNMTAYEGVSLAGQTYQSQDDGRLNGTFSPQIIPPSTRDIRTTGWTFNVPPATAALLQIPLVSGTSRGVGGDVDVVPNLDANGTQEAVDPLEADNWTPPVAVPFPPIPGFPQPPPGEEAQDAAGDDAAGAAGSGSDAAGLGPADAAGSGSLGGGTAPGLPAAGGGAAGDRSNLFEYDAQALKRAAAGQQQQQQQQSQPAAPAASAGAGAAGGRAGQYVLQGFTPEGRPVYAWRPAVAGRAYTQPPPPQQQQQQQQQQQAVPQHARLASSVLSSKPRSLLGWFGKLRRGSAAASSSSVVTPAATTAWSGGAGQQQLPTGAGWGAFAPAAAPFAAGAVQYTGFAPTTGVGAATSVGGGGVYSPYPATASAAAGTDMGWAGAAGQSGMLLAGSSSSDSMAAPGRLEAGQMGGVSRLSPSSMGTAVGGLGSGGIGGVNAGLPAAGVGIIRQGAGGGSGGVVGGRSGTAAAQAAGNVGVSVDINIPLPTGTGMLGGAPLPQYLMPSLNFVPPKSTTVDLSGGFPKAQPVAQNAGAEFQASGPVGVGLIWPPAGGQPGVGGVPPRSTALNLGVPGMGGYQLLPPGYDEAAVQRAAEVCPGIKRIYDIQGRAGLS